MSITQIAPSRTVHVFEAYCNRCHKVREARIKSEIVGSKEIEYLICLCGNPISVNILKYLFREKSYIEDRLNYFIS